MTAESRNIPEQERSIKAREHELYAKPLSETDAQATKPFPDYLRATPALPLSPATKTMLWVLAVVVVLVFLAAIWRASQHRGPRARNKAAPASVPSATVADYRSARGERPLALAVIRYKWTP
jgi:hypothetical protein